ncbi:MAG: molecular chaperone TorD family protein [Slackia sp.]|nr:molecular chaperone TorD family protein [Slackia sp.]
MEERNSKALHRAIGLSDLATLSAASFEFPRADLARALADGAFLDDWRASMVDARGALPATDEELTATCAAAFRGEEACEATLRREYSRMFLAPGIDVPVWPYESCFRHRASGAQGTPSLFRSPIAIAVERCMREAGVATVDEHREPGDSIFRELQFLAYLHAREGEAIRVDDGVDRVAWHERIVSFATDHALVWMPAFMEQAAANALIEPYRLLAKLGARYLDELECFVQEGE